MLRLWGRSDDIAEAQKRVKDWHPDGRWIDRSQFEYPVLLGRSALAGIAVVDPEEINLSEPACRVE